MTTRVLLDDYDRVNWIDLVDWLVNVLKVFRQDDPWEMEDNARVVVEEELLVQDDHYSMSWHLINRSTFDDEKIRDHVEQEKLGLSRPRAFSRLRHFARRFWNLCDSESFVDQIWQLTKLVHVLHLDLISSLVLLEWKHQDIVFFRMNVLIDVIDRWKMLFDFVELFSVDHRNYVVHLMNLVLHLDDGNCQVRCWRWEMSEQVKRLKEGKKRKCQVFWLILSLSNEVIDEEINTIHSLFFFRTIRIDFQFFNCID